MKQSARKVVGAVLVGAAVLPLAAQVWEYAAEVPLYKSVGSGTETLAGRLIVGNDQRLYKTGGGDWILPYGLLDVYWPFAAEVTDGGISVGTGANEGTDPGAFSLPASIADKALIWVDAADPQASHLAGTGDEVAAWYDRREGTDISSPKHFYAKADDLSTGGNPEIGTYDGRTGVFFGGVGSCKCMPWYKPNGTRAGLTGGIYHFFAVTGVSNSWGCIYGSISSDGSAWITDAQTCADLSKNTTKYFWNNNMQYAPNSRCFRNGERLDPLQDVQCGVQLLDMSMGETMNFTGKAAAFFDERNMSGKVGGDYLHEAICFTNMLTEAELQQVRAYLMRKWQIAGQKDVRVKLAAKAELAVDTTSGVTTNGANVIGAGAIVKTGANDLVYRNLGGVAYEGLAGGSRTAAGGTRFDGEIDVRSGAVAMLSQAAVSAVAGKRLSNASAFGAARPRVTVSAAAADALVKDGAGDILVNGVPDGVKKLSVEAGRLELRNVAAKAPLDDGGAFEVAIPNSGFEDETDDEFADGSINVKKAGTHGWYASTSDNVKMIHMSKWTGKSAAMDNNTRANWKFFSDPPEGDGVLYVSNGNYAETDVTIPSAGRYELTFRLAGREGYVRNDVGTASLVGSETVDFGRYLYYFSTGSDRTFSNPAGYEKIVLRTYVATPGSYRLRISRQPSVSGNQALLYDDFHLRRLADVMPEAIPVSGGSFESVALPTSTDLTTLQTFSADMTVEGWAFAVPAGWTDAKPAAGITTPRIKGKWGQGEWYNDSRGPGCGFAEAFFRAPTTAMTSFTAMESGTFRVQADLACFHSAGGSMQLTATVNGEAHDLGTISPDHKIMRTEQWPLRLTIAAGDSVTLTFAFTRTGSDAGLWMDDVCLAKKCIPVEGNLVKNGSFEKFSNNYTFANWTVASGSVLQGDSEATASEVVAAFGHEKVDGRYFVRFQGQKSGGSSTLFYQDVNFPREGVYRLSFYSHCRLTSNAASQTCPTKWWLAKGGVTNQLIRTANDTKGYAEHTVDFYVPSADTYRLGISPDQTSLSWYDTMLDAVSIIHIGDLQPTDGFSEDMVVEVAVGAKLGVCFAGTNRIDRLRLGGKSVHGFIDAKSHPDYITGTGTFEVCPYGALLIVR